MNLGFSSSLAGLNAAATAITVSASNVSRVNVIGAEKQGVTFTTNDLGEVKAQVYTEKLTSSQKSAFAEYNPNTIDLASEFVNQMIFSTSFKANLALLNKSSNLEKSLVNLKV